MENKDKESIRRMNDLYQEIDNSINMCSERHDDLTDKEIITTLGNIKKEWEEDRREESEEWENRQKEKSEDIYLDWKEKDEEDYLEEVWTLLLDNGKKIKISHDGQNTRISYHE